MIAVRKLLDKKSGQNKSKLPNESPVKKMDKITLAFKGSFDRGQNLNGLLLVAPTLNDNDLQEYEIIKERMSQWNIEEF